MESTELDGHRFKLEGWGKRGNAVAVVMVALYALFVLIWFTTDRSPPWFVGVFAGLWVGVPSWFELTVHDGGLRISSSRNLLGKLMGWFSSDPIARLRGDFTSGSGVLIPWEAVESVAARPGRKRERILVLGVKGESVELQFAIREADEERFERLVELTGRRSTAARPAEVPADVQRLRGRARVPEG